MTINSADYFMLLNEWGLSRSRVCLLRLEVDLGSVLEAEQTEMEIWCVKGMFMLKVVSSKTNLGFNVDETDLYYRTLSMHS